MASNEMEILDPAATVEQINEIAARRALNRRHFLAAIGMTGAAAGAGLLSGCSTSTTPVTNVVLTTAQTDLLNFALNFKYLEATFYSYVTQGKDLTGTAIVSSGAVTNAPAQVVFTVQQVTDVMNEIYFDEKSHVNTLISLLGTAAVFRPAINLAAYAPITATNALSIARLLEDVGTTALAAIATGLSDSSVTLISQILGAESFHAGALRLLSIQNPTIGAYLRADTLDVAPADEGSAALAAAGPAGTGAFFATAGASSATVADPAGVAFVRSTSQVLSILYGSGGVVASSGTSSGGFFPGGVNGNIKTV
jgi:Ferritin-like domain